MNEQLQKLIAMLQDGVNKGGAAVGGKVSSLSNMLAGEEVKNMNPLIAQLGQAGVNAGNFITKNPGQALGGAALGGLNLAGLADQEDILSQLLAAAGGAGIGYAKGGVPGAVWGGLGGGAAGDMLPKLVRMLQGNNQ